MLHCIKTVCNTMWSAHIAHLVKGLPGSAWSMSACFLARPCFLHSLGTTNGSRLPLASHYTLNERYSLALYRGHSRAEQHVLSANSNRAIGAIF